MTYLLFQMLCGSKNTFKEVIFFICIFIMVYSVMPSARFISVPNLYEAVIEEKENL